MKLSITTNKKQSLNRKLFEYMCILAALLLIQLLVSMYLIGSFTGTKQRVADTLSFQLEIFEQQIDTYYDNLAVMGVQLSSEATAILEKHLSENSLSFEELNDSEEQIFALQEKLIEALRHKLWEADCTGAFIMLEAKVNSSVLNAEFSRTGIYLQRNSLEISDNRVLLYRGLAQVGKDHDCMPHRKWRLEFNTKLFPNYDELKENAALPLKSSYRLTDIVTLPGTDQHVMLMSVPLLGKDESFYGLCGFEINEGYFKQMFAQPSELERAIFCVSKKSGDLKFSEQTLSSGVLNKYYLEPSGSFVSKPFGNGLIEYIGETSSYIGSSKEIQLCPGNCTSAISVLMPKLDYDHMLMHDTARMILLIAAFLIIAAGLAFFFTKRYIRPLMQNIDQIRKKEYDQDAAYATEIGDLFAFLAEQDRINEAELEKIRNEKAAALIAIDEIQIKYDEATRQTERLAYSRKDEIDPYDYENFKLGLKTLTPKENEVLKLYIEGKTVKDIIAILQLQESTVRFHNKNIYAKLGVHSLKQLLRYAAVLKQEEGQS